MTVLLEIKKELPRHRFGDLGRDWGDWTYTIFVSFVAEVIPSRVVASSALQDRSLKKCDTSFDLWQRGIEE
jgi:hypothetical protein